MSNVKCQISNKYQLNIGHWILDIGYSRRAGFTLIELLVVFSIIAIISSIGIASFRNYSDSQKLRSATLDLKTMLQQARSESLSQVKPNSCGAFQGYEVRICCIPSGSNCPTCLSSGNYELDAICSSSPQGISISSTQLPSGISVDTLATNQRTFRFIPITGGVVMGGNIVLDGKIGTNASQSAITVTGTGVIQ